MPDLCGVTLTLGGNVHRCIEADGHPDLCRCVCSRVWLNHDHDRHDEETPR